MLSDQMILLESQYIEDGWLSIIKGSHNTSLVLEEIQPQKLFLLTKHHVDSCSFKSYALVVVNRLYLFHFLYMTHHIVLCCVSVWYSFQGNTYVIPQSILFYYSLTPFITTTTLLSTISHSRGTDHHYSEQEQLQYYCRYRTTTTAHA